MRAKSRTCWMLQYENGQQRLIWADYREPLASGALAFYDLRRTDDPISFATVDHVYAVAPFRWADVRRASRLEIVEENKNNLPTIGESW